MRKSVVLALTAIVLSACGPVAPEDSTDVVDRSDEAVAFRKSATGTWMSECETFAEGSTFKSEKMRLTIDGNNAQIQTYTHSAGLCKGTASNVSVFNSTLKVIDVSTSSHVILDLVSKQKIENELYRQTLETSLSRTGTMNMRLLKASFWQGGEEQALRENELGRREYNFNR